jgi:hypothetical protein
MNFFYCLTTNFRRNRSTNGKEVAHSFVFNDACIIGYIPSRLEKYLMTSCKGFGSRWSWPNSVYYINIYLEYLRKPTKI